MKDGISSLFSKPTFFLLNRFPGRSEGGGDGDCEDEDEDESDYDIRPLAISSARPLFSASRPNASPGSSTSDVATAAAPSLSLIWQSLPPRTLSSATKSYWSLATLPSP